MIHALGLLAAVAVAAASPPDDEGFFESRIRPILARSCVGCHGPAKASGGLRLDSRDALLKGGKQGPAVEPDEPEESRLLRAVRRSDDAAPMPPDRPLAPEAVRDLGRWVAGGTPWPARAPPVRADRHWAFEPVRAVDPPRIPAASPIDAFLAAGHREKGLTPLAGADRPTLIRRATFDLIGLPPSPEEVQRFLADDSPGAFEAVVDRLLASPAHGQKWGRAWLDVAHYADTAGETADFPVPDAWRYRDYVIDAINADKPYDQFLREQIAGDILAGELPAGAPTGRFAELVTATGYLAVARRFGSDSAKDHYLTLDDTIDTLGKGLLGLTIACARCHDHKYDPIAAADYYALYGILDSTRYPYPGAELDKVPRDNVPLLSTAEQAQRLAPLRAESARAQAALAVAEKTVAEAAAQAPRALAAGEIANGGRQDLPALAGADALRAVEVRPGEMIRLVVSPRSNHGADSTRVELKVVEQGGGGRDWDLARDVLPEIRRGRTAFGPANGPGAGSVWWAWDGTATPRLFPALVKGNEMFPGLLAWWGDEPYPCVFANTNDRAVAYGSVKLPTASVALHPGPRGPIVLAWESPIAGTVAVSGLVEDIDAQGGDGVGWSIAVGPGLGRALAGAAEATAALDRARAALAASEGSIPRAYAVAEGRPHDARIQLKGDPATLGPEVPRRSLAILGGQPIARGSGSGRRDLADWIAGPANPLTARVIVNRLWQGHFGRGLVRTPDNFGLRGEPPDHPELLDWLAARLVADGWSLKTLHRRMILSDAYRRASGDDPGNARIDPDNRALWRFERRRLTAEEIRDAMLAVAGGLDPTPGGSHPFPDSKTWAFTQHNPFQAVYDHDRRSVYLMTQRIKRHPFLALFDGADPNSCTGRRDSTVVPTQALFFLNDPFVHARADDLARRLARLPDDPSRLDRACSLLFGRPPRPVETAVSARFLAESAAEMPDKPADEQRRAAWAGWIRVLFSSNEFCHVD